MRELTVSAYNESTYSVMNVNYRGNYFGAMFSRNDSHAINQSPIRKHYSNTRNIWQFDGWIVIFFVIQHRLNGSKRIKNSSWISSCKETIKTWSDEISYRFGWFWDCTCYETQEQCLDPTLHWFKYFLTIINMIIYNDN